MPNRSASELTPAAELVDRFRRDVEALTGEAPGADRKLGLAVSGGADSLALLLLAAAAYPGAVTAATVDHGLRQASAGEAAFVHRLCGDLGVPHEILQRPEALVVEGNVQEQARGLRYTLLNFWGGSNRDAARPWRAEWVATAHQLDDVAETFLMRARRGAGVGGLATMRAARPLHPMPGPALVRPLLGWRRSELAAIVAAADIAPIDDPSNADPRFDRSRMRALLAGTTELPPARLKLAADNLRHAEDALAWAADRAWEARGRIAADRVALDPRGLPYELRRRLARRAIETIRFDVDLPGSWEGEGLDRLVHTLDAGGTATLAGVKAAARRGDWHFAPAPPRRSH